MIKNNAHNIGWNKITFSKKKSDFYALNNKSFYFQHQYMYAGSSKYTISVSKDLKNLTSIIKYKNTFGVQFHPEKSQLAGLEFFKILLEKI